jgi:hypothetical protein
LSAGLDVESIGQTTAADCRGNCSIVKDCTFYIFTDAGRCILKSDFANGPNGANVEASSVIEACIKLPAGESFVYMCG